MVDLINQKNLENVELRIELIDEVKIKPLKYLKWENGVVKLS